MIKRFTAIVALTSVLLLPASARADDDLVPANDNFASATSIAALPFSDAYLSRLATPELFEPDCVGGQTTWYSYTPTEDVDVIADSLRSWDGYYSIGVYTGGSRFRDLTLVACNGHYFYGEARVAMKLSAGKTYYFQVGSDSQDGNDGITHFNLARPSSIHGVVTDQFGAPVKGVNVYASPMDPYTSNPGFSGRAQTDSAGSYNITGLSAGAFQVRFFSSNPDYFSETYDEKGTSYNSGYDLVHVGPEQSVSLNEDLILGAKITGTVYDEAGSPLDRICVRAVDHFETIIGSSVTSSDGTYTMRRLTTGQYRLLFRDCSAIDRVNSEWYDDQLRFADAEVVTLTTGDLVSNIDAYLSPTSVPANDQITNAIEVTQLPFEDVPTTYLATTQVGEPRCNTNASKTLWYKLVSDRKQLVSVDANSIESAHGIGVYQETGLDTESGDLNYLTVDCERPLGSRASTAFEAEANQVYWIQLEGYGGRVELSILREEIPANDDLAGALDVGTLPSAHLARTHAATTENGEPVSCQTIVHGVDHGHSVWYKLTPSPDQTEIEVDTVGSGFNTVLVVYRASGRSSGFQLADLEEVACNDNASGTTRQSRLSFVPTAGTTYFVQATGYQGDSGPLRLNVRSK